MVSYLNKCIDNAGSRRVVNKYISILPKHSIVFLIKDCSVNSNRAVSMVRSWNGLKLSKVIAVK